jgi:leucyl aminopeptidase
MADRVTVSFADLNELARVEAGADAGTLVIFAGKDDALSPAAQNLLGAYRETLRKAAATAKFKGSTSSALDLLAPAGLAWSRLLVVGTSPKKGAEASAPGTDHATLGGYVMSKIGGSDKVTIAFDLPEAPKDAAAAAADFALGLRLRAYKFDLYKSKKPEDDEKDTAVRVSIALADPEAARKAAGARDAIAEGVAIARDLVNEPANVLYPVEFAERTRELEKLGVEVEILDVAALEKIGMRTLLGVGQGSRRESRVVIMRWKGASTGSPVAFIGKGVCFDTGGISIKPAGGMEDMKGDMAGAACVVGLMHALAARKAKVDVIGAIGIVENMPDGNAQRPGDIVKSLAGHTVEVINTDAEGRLVLADVLWYVQDRFKPKFMIDLATLTGAILVALGNEHAGLFSNDDELAARLSAAGQATGEKVWRMPLGAAYDKLIDSKFADMKNVGGRHAGSITAAQFLKRFVNDVPWAHLDIAGTGMGSPQTDINQSWASGWGVRLLDRLVADHYEE